MKNIIKKNKILFLAVAIVLAGGILLTVLLVSQTQGAMTGGRIETAQAEAAETADAKTPDKEPTPDAVMTPQPTDMTNPGQLGRIISEKEGRRDYIIPSLDGSVVNEADTWKITEPQRYKSIKEKALTEAARFAQAFFGYTIAANTVDFRYYSDTSGHRGDIIRVYTIDEKIICTLAAETLDLINIDYYFSPDVKMNENSNYEMIQDNDREVADMIASVFKTTVSDIEVSGGGGGQGIWTNTYNVIMDNGKLVKFAMVNGTLYAIGVYPSEASMRECVYFDADVQLDPSIVKLASEQDFKKGQPSADDMTQEEAESMYMKFLTQANGDGQYDLPKMTFYIDNSGTRENYWHMESNKLTMDISSKSKWIISLTCANLLNPSQDLSLIDYGSMGGKEYEEYLSGIMKDIYGDGFLNAGVNAVYDDHYCTEDAWMADGSVYEFMFEDGKLQQVIYFSDENCFRICSQGWKADHEYINTVSGETFIPN